jgi:hypothetical protein
MTGNKGKEWDDREKKRHEINGQIKEGGAKDLRPISGETYEAK